MVAAVSRWLIASEGGRKGTVIRYEWMDEHGPIRSETQDEEAG